MTDKMFPIKSKLLTLEGYSVFATSIRMAAKNDLPGCLKMIREQAKDNRGLVEKIIGPELLIEIDPEVKCWCFLCHVELIEEKDKLEMFGETVCNQCWDDNMQQALQDGGGL